MATSRPLLERLLTTPDSARVLSRLQPDVVQRVIQATALEDSAEFVAHLSAAQLSRVLDLDVWRAARPGRDEAFDAERFGVWIGVLMQSGAAVAAEKLLGLDRGLVAAGLAQLVSVADSATVSPCSTLDGDYIERAITNAETTCEAGGYVVVSRGSPAWEFVRELLVFLDGEYPDFFRQLMRTCVRLSSGQREEDGLDRLLGDDEQHIFDLASAREMRRDSQGYVSPTEAAAFLQAARAISAEGAPPESAIARAHLRERAWTPDADLDAEPESLDLAQQPDSGSVRAMFDILADAGVLAPPELPLIGGEQSIRLTRIAEFMAANATCEEALAFLVNTLVAGCSIQGRAFTPREAMDAVLATCNLGLENWPAHWPRRDVLLAFQVGWTVLTRDVCQYAATCLAETLENVACNDRDVKLELSRLRHSLAVHLRDGTPWRARRALDVILMLDSTCWAGLLGAIDECPVAHVAVTARHTRRHRIAPGDFEFISENCQIGSIRAFMDSLTHALAF